MSREGFDFGAEVAAAGGKVFKNPTPGPHDTLITGIVHIGSFADVFKQGNVLEPKPACNFVLVQSTLMGEEDKNEDGSRIQKWQAMPLKFGNKANLTKFMLAVDPTEKMKGFDDVIMTAVTTQWKPNEKKGKNEDGTYKAVNLDGYAGMAERSAKLVKSDAEEEGIKPIGHVKFEDITLEILEEIPGYLIRQYLLSESDTGAKNLSYPSSAVEAIILAKRETDPTWKTKQESDSDDESQEPGHEQRDGSTANASSVPEPAFVEAPADLAEDREF